MTLSTLKKRRSPFHPWFARNGENLWYWLRSKTQRREWQQQHYQFRTFSLPLPHPKSRLPLQFEGSVRSPKVADKTKEYLHTFLKRLVIKEQQDDFHLLEKCSVFPPLKQVLEVDLLFSNWIEKKGLAWGARMQPSNIKTDLLLTWQGRYFDPLEPFHSPPSAIGAAGMHRIICRLLRRFCSNLT